MSGLNIETNSLSNTAFPENRKPDEKPSEHDLQLFYSTLNDRPADRARLVNRSNLTDRLGKLNTPAAWVQESSYIPKLRATGGTPAQQAALSQTIGDFKEQFTAHAQSREEFHSLLTQAFGSIDADQAEEIRLKTLDGDFSWLPKIELVSGDPTFRGAYSADEGTVFLNQVLLDDPADASRVLTEEIGHHLETRVRKGDNPGDEGELFRRLFAGETLNRGEIATLRHENDHGVIRLNGRDIQVEFDDGEGGGNGFDIGGSIILTAVIGSLLNSDADDNAEFDFDVDSNGTRFVRARGDGWDHDIWNAYGDRNGLRAFFNGRIIEGDDRWAFILNKIPDTHNNYEFVATKTPYDDLAQASGISWQELDRAYLDLQARGLTEQANSLQNDGVLPPLSAFEPGSPIETALRGHYDRLAQQVADDTGFPIDIIIGMVNDLYVTNGIQASNLMLGKIPISEVRSVVATEFIYNEMINNAQSATVEEIKTLLNSNNPINNGLALVKYGLKTCDRCDWDHKPDLESKLGLPGPPADFFFPIQGDSTHEYFYDIWSNVHFGYVGTAAGFDAQTLQDGAAFGDSFTGVNDESDVLSVQIGIDLWNKYGINLTRDQLRQEILSHTDDYIRLRLEAGVDENNEDVDKHIIAPGSRIRPDRIDIGNGK